MSSTTSNTGSHDRYFAVLDLHQQGSGIHSEKKTVAFSSDMKLLRAGPYLTWSLVKACKSVFFLLQPKNQQASGQKISTNCADWALIFSTPSSGWVFPTWTWAQASLEQATVHLWSECWQAWLVPSDSVAFCLDVQMLLLGDSPTHSLPTHTLHTKPNSAWDLQLAFEKMVVLQERFFRGRISDGGWQLAVSPVHLLIPLKWYNGTGPIIHLEFDIIMLIIWV